MTGVWKQPLFLFGFILLGSIIAASVVHSVFYDSMIPVTDWLKDSKGNIVASPPLEPSQDIVMGTDEFGKHMAFKLLDGAKFTLGAAFVTSLLGFSLSLLGGVLLAFWDRQDWKFLTKGLGSSFYFVPQSIIAYNVLYPILWEPPEGFTYSVTERIVYEIVILALILVPTTALLIASETEELLKKEFIQSAITLGATPFYLFKRHIQPHLRARLLILFSRIVVQVLLVISHLGIFQIYFGGTSVCYEAFCDPPAPIANEWSSLLGMSIQLINYQWWLPVGPLLCITISIVAINCLADGMEKGLAPRKRLRVKKKNKVGDPKRRRDSIQSETSFQFVKTGR
ncbi:hypothetical protein Q75_16860 [Bacillus coahuilensis p1.1.43]|uniref:ABC transmembrane type-1 domain-containing protein n=1 Tax=Bacillus coahuilensis p1.1.43 TaxID=1150625 RepID=A0A147K3W7_9BACI|nr:ABC transporter permease subunit [Bacillus coahuilensis]KUP03987.1 hypothetical protein Q75_16860 [Bacillus coahuilensis p1.1.43]